MYVASLSNTFTYMYIRTYACVGQFTVVTKYDIIAWGEFAIIINTVVFRGSPNTCMLPCMYTYIYIRMRTYVHVCMYIRMYACMYMYVCAYMYLIYVFSHACTYVHVHTRVQSAISPMGSIFKSLQDHLRHLQIVRSNIRYKEMIGEGAFGEVRTYTCMCVHISANYKSDICQVNMSECQVDFLRFLITFVLRLTMQS